MMHRILALAAATVWSALPARADEITGAAYGSPVERYGHFALGRPHEYARIHATTASGREAELSLPADEVFEDLAPRPLRLEADGERLLLVVVSARDSGSRLALVGLRGAGLEIVAESAAIGTPNRWLNPVGVADLDGDGVAEIAAVTTPHIGGVLRVYRRAGERLQEVASLAGFSNHVYGSAELGLSRPARIGGEMRLLVPDARRAQVRMVGLRPSGLVETGRCTPPTEITTPAALDVCAAR